MPLEFSLSLHLLSNDRLEKPPICLFVSLYINYIPYTSRHAAFSECSFERDLCVEARAVHGEDVRGRGAHAFGEEVDGGWNAVGEFGPAEV